MTNSGKKRNEERDPESCDSLDENMALAGPIRHTKRVKRVPRIEWYNPNDPETWMYSIMRR